MALRGRTSRSIQQKKLFVVNGKRKRLFVNISGSFACLSTLILKLQKFKNNSPHNLRELLACLNSLKRDHFISIKVRVLLRLIRSRLVLHVVIPGCLEAGQNGDAFTYAVPPRMEKGLDSRHILSGSGRD